MDFYSLSGLFIAIVAFGFGMVVISRNWRLWTNRLFFLMTLAVTIWAFGYWQWLTQSEGATALFWVRIFTVGSILIPIFYFHWVTRLLDIEKRQRAVIILGYLLTCFFLAFSFSDYLIVRVEPKLFFPFWPVAGTFYGAYIGLLFIGLIGYGVILLLRHYHSSSREKQGQIVYIVLGTLAGFGGGLTNFFLWYNIPIPPYGNILVALFPFFLGYATLKHHLFNVRILSTELLTFCIWIFLIIQILLANTLQQQLTSFTLLILVIFFGIFLIKSVTREVEQREKMEALSKELASANVELKKLDAAKSEFVSIASHQLRAPLTIIKGYVSLITEGTLGKITDQAKEALAKVALSAEQLIKLVGDLLDLSRIESGKIRYEFKPGNLVGLVEEVVEEIKSSAEKKGLNLNFAHPGSIPNFSFDPDKMREVAVNLIDNAIKYSNHGEILIKLDPVVRDGIAAVRFSVKDDGIGLRKEDIARLFTKFMRSQEAQKVDPSGMGIGLYFVKKIVEDHGGKVGAESDGPGEGSTFIVELPVQQKLKA